jgi:serine/threonine protein kinase
MPGAACGTAAYMSPEQIRGEPVDARSDLFSLGVTLYQMATGSLPFSRGTTEQIMEAIAKMSPVPPRMVNAAVPSELERIILKALQKDRTRRYQSAADLNRDLTRLLTWRSRVGRRKLVIVSALLIAAATSAAVNSGFFTILPRVPELALRRVTANPIEDPVFRGSMSADGWYSAYSDLTGLHIRRIDTGETRSIIAPEGLCFR